MPRSQHSKPHMVSKPSFFFKLEKKLEKKRWKIRETLRPRHTVYDFVTRKVSNALNRHKLYKKSFLFIYGIQ